ncbi:hypothetical protein JL09_g4942 [Pichia kudriavzevii]|uniref:Uncharacterized protein n=1 Tax=Pichia kudriavzevii TaxID=4909 RepID=A0A099NSZ3_PICKU|nr:hypothetical protein JL09_g4942 [Pichia kudriavzevii]
MSLTVADKKNTYKMYQLGNGDTLIIIGHLIKTGFPDSFSGSNKKVTISE